MQKIDPDLYRRKAIAQLAQAECVLEGRQPKPTTGISYRSLVLSIED